MSFYKKVVGNIFAKIIIAFVVLTFVLFGVSDFLLSGSGSWAAKVGGSTISVGEFTKSLRESRDALMRISKDPKAAQYANSVQFKSDVLGRLVNQKMVEKMSDEFDFTVSRELILQDIAKNEMFKNKEGKFDYERLKEFLANNGFDDKEYISMVSNEIAANVIAQTLTMVSPHHDNTITEIAKYQQEERFADVVTLSVRDIKSVKSPSDEETEEYFSKNKDQYKMPEFRTVSYVQFSREDFAKDLEITEEDLRQAYEAQKEEFVRPETRSFYHMVFDEEKEADDFVKKVKTAAKSGKYQAAFSEVTKNNYKKKASEISVTKILKKDFIAEIADKVFQLKQGELSQPLQSPIGFHVFLTTEINAEKQLSFKEARQQVLKLLKDGREERVLQSKIESINDLALIGESLEDLKKESSLKGKTHQVVINDVGKTKSGKEEKEIAKLQEFVSNSFAAKKGRISKVFADKEFQNFYLLKVEEVESSRSQTLKEAKQSILADLSKKKRQDALVDLVAEVSKEIKADPKNISKIAKKYDLKMSSNRKFNRRIYFEVGEGRRVAYDSKFLDELFSVKVGEATDAVTEDGVGFTIGVLNKISLPKFSDSESRKLVNQSVDSFRTEIFELFSAYMMKKYPIKVNEKLLQE